MALINIHYYPCFIYIIFRILAYIIRYLLRNYCKTKFNYISHTFLMFLGESLAGFVYLFEQKLLKKNKEDNKNNEIVMKQFERIDKKQNIKKYILIICLCGLLDFFFCYEFDFHPKINDLNEQLLNIKRIIFILILCISENYYLNLETNIHHYLGLTLSLVSLIIIIISNFTIFENNKFLLLLFLLYIEFGFIGSCLYLIEKQLSFKYYINIYFIIFIEGISGCFYCIINYLILKITGISVKNSLISDTMNLSDIFLFIIIIFFDCIISCVYNICIIKISEKNRPSYNLIGELVNMIFINTYNSLFGYKNVWNIQLILFTIFSLLGSFIFCEVITLNFFGFDKYTFEKTSHRSKFENEISIVNDSVDSIEKNE